jgi:Protein of unknown function (DUF1189)
MPSHLSALLRATVDFNLYREVLKQRARRTLAYMLLLALLAAAATATWGTLRLRELARRLDPHLDQLPTITIRNGEASADVEQPWVKRLGPDRHGNEVVLIIDTTGERSDFEPREIGLFLQRTQLLVKGSDDDGGGGETHALPLSRVRDCELGPKQVRAWIARVMRRVPFVLCAVAFVYYFVVRALQALVLVLVALAASGKRRVALRFGQLYTIAAYALTPAIVFDAALKFLPFHVPRFWLIYWAVAALYTALAATRVPDDDAPPPATPATPETPAAS